MRASVVSSRRRVTATTRAPCPLMVPANTSSPGAFSTGTDSPVIGAWLTSDRPSRTVPSSAKRSPGRTCIIWPGSTRSSGTQPFDAAVLDARLDRRQIQQRPNCRARAVDALRLEPLRHENRNTTIAASSHSPITSAPATAITISALMSSAPRRSADQARRAGNTAPATTATRNSGWVQAGAPSCQLAQAPRGQQHRGNRRQHAARLRRGRARRLGRAVRAALANDVRVGASSDAPLLRRCATASGSRHGFARRASGPRRAGRSRADRRARRTPCVPRDARERAAVRAAAAAGARPPTATATAPPPGRTRTARRARARRGCGPEWDRRARGTSRPAPSRCRPATSAARSRRTRVRSIWMTSQASSELNI